MSGILQALAASNYILEMLAACLLFALPLKREADPGRDLLAAPSSVWQSAWGWGS